MIFLMTQAHKRRSAAAPFSHGLYTMISGSTLEVLEEVLTGKPILGKWEHDNELENHHFE